MARSGYKSGYIPGDASVGGPRHLRKRDGIWHYYRRVPAQFQDVDERTFVRVSLNTRDLEKAERLKAAIARAVEQRWLALKKGKGADADEQYAGAVELAKLEGFEYRSVSTVASGPLDDLLRRVERLEDIGVADKEATMALLGGHDTPSVTVRRAYDMFLSHTRDKTRDYSADQLRRWKAPRLKAVNNFIQVVDDKALTEITRQDALTFRAWWIDRLEEKGLTANSANKDLGHLNQIFSTVSDAYQLGVGRPFAGLRLQEDKTARRTAFTSDWIRDAILADGVLDGLNDQAHGIVLALVETGLRPSEACGLEPADIRLDHDIPHLALSHKPNRKLKTTYSQRDVPLIGVSLEAMRRHADGFPRYRDKSSQLSAAVNKFMRNCKLLPDDGHSLYSFRHAFQDRLTAVDMPDRVQADLMGHKFGRPVYGEGATLEHKRDWLLRVAVSKTK